MGNLYSYSAITTKIRSMQGHLISPSAFREMAALGSVTEFASYLKRYPSYAHMFESKDPENLHRSDIEKLLLREKYSDFAKIYRFANQRQRKYMRLYFLSYELGILKRCIRRCINGKKPDVDFSENADFFRKHGKLDLIRLMQIDNMPSLIEALKGSIWYDPLFEISKQDSAMLFDYTDRLDLFYFKTIWTEKDHLLNKTENRLITTCFGAQLDLLNLQWIYRSKKYYHLPDTEIYNLLIPEYYQLKPGEIKALVEAKDDEGFRNCLKETRYGKIKDRLSPAPMSLEQLYFLVLEHIYESTAKKDPYSFAIVNSYLHRKDTEIHKIITVMESIRYHLPPDIIITGILKSAAGGFSK